MSTINLADQLITADRAARRLAVSSRTLRAWRAQGSSGPPFVQVGSMIRYRVSDLDAWIEQRTIQPTTPDAA